MIVGDLLIGDGAAPAGPGLVIDDWNDPSPGSSASLSAPPPTVGRTGAAQGHAGRIWGGWRTFYVYGASRVDESEEASLATFGNGPDASSVVFEAYRLNAVFTVVWDGTERTFGASPTVSVNQAGVAPADFSGAGSTIRMPIVPGYASAPAGTTLALTLYDGTHSATGTATLADGDTAVEWPLSGFAAVNTAAITAAKLVVTFPPLGSALAAIEVGALAVMP